MGVKHIFGVLRHKKQEACIMRLYKKAAAVLLAAAMAVSMMTACGDSNGGGNPENPDSKPGVTDPEKPGDGKDDNKGDDKKDDTALPDLDKEDGIDISWQSSKAGQYVQWLNSKQSYSMTTSTTVAGSAGKLVTFSAVSNGKTYSKVIEDGIDSSDVTGMAMLNTGKYTYQMYPKVKIAFKNENKTSSSDDSTTKIDTALSVKKGTKTYNGKTYYAEKVTAIVSEGDKKTTQVMTYCLNEQDMPEYIFTKTDRGVAITQISDLKTDVDQKLFEVPSDYEVYITVVSKDGKSGYVAHENGVPLTKEEMEELAKKLSSIQ